MTPPMVTAVKDLAWRERTSASKIVRDILETIIENPGLYLEVVDTDQPVPSVFTVYVPDDLWYRARDVAYSQGRMGISTLIRKGLIARLEDIPA